MRRQYEWAKLKGVEARQRNAKRTDNPYRNKPSQRVLEGAWDSGWILQDPISRGRK